MKRLVSAIVSTVLVLVLIGCNSTATKPMARNTLRSVDIDDDCTVDYEQVNLSKHKGHSLQWTTGGDFEIRFDKPEGTPCVDSPASPSNPKPNKKDKFAAKNGHNSDKCYPDPNAQEYTAYHYSIYKNGTKCNDPAVIVQDGKAPTPTDR